MAKVVLHMSMSVDGFIAGPDDSEENGLGVGGELLHGWLADGGADPASYRPSDEAGATVFDEALATGAVITGRRTFEFAGGWAGDHHDGVPIFVLTRAAPAEPPPGSARYVSDIASAVAGAKAAAGDRDILLHGAATAQECLRAGLLDAMQLAVVPVLLGRGRRLFADLPTVELELTRALDGPGAAHLTYEVR
jgi:dihydrofolate reductase